MSIWQGNIDDEYALKPINIEDIKKAEAFFNVSFPKEYIELLLVQNGGYINFNAHPSPKLTVLGDHFVTIEYIKGIGKQNGILENDYFIKEWGMPEGLILFHGDGHTWLAFDYREVNVDPSIVYIDNETEEVIKLADSFKQFLSNLYNEEEIDPGDSHFYQPQFTTEDFDLYVEQDLVDNILEGLMYIGQSDVDNKWLSGKLLQLSAHPFPPLRIETANTVWNLLYRMEDEILEKIIENFKRDDDIDIKNYTELILEKLNYPFEKLADDLVANQMMSFAYEGTIYHLNEHSGQWHLSDFEKDIQYFNSPQELVSLATIDGQPLKEIWGKVKIV